MIDYFKNLIKTQFTIHFFVAGIVCMIVSIFYEREIFTYMTFISFFTVFDVVGYGNMIHLTQSWDDEKIVVPYRIMQNFFMIMIFIVVYFYTGWICLLACVLGWWMGGCDLLYYITLRNKLPDEDYWWMKGWSVWIIITWIKKLLLIDEYISRTEFAVVCSIGLAIGGVVVYLF